MIDLKNHYGFTRTPFGKDLAPSMLHRYPAHSEAVARITGDWAADVKAFDDIFTEILVLADTLHDGIVAQFPERFAEMATA